MQVKPEHKTRSSEVASLCQPPLPSWLACIRLKMADDVKLMSDDGEKWVLTSPKGSIPFRLPAGKLRSVFSRLGGDGCTMLELIPELGDSTDPLSINEQLLRLWRGGLLIQVLQSEGEPCAKLRSYGETPIAPPLIDLSRSVVLSDYTCIRKQGNSLLLESVEVGAVVHLEDPQLFPIVAALARPTDCEQVVRQMGLAREMVLALISWLVSIDAVKCHEAEVPYDMKHAGWAFADRLLHARSRAGRHVGGYGGTFRLKGEVEQPAPLRPTRGEERTPLPTPQLERIAAQDPPLTAVLESRRSVRDHSTKPITCVEMSEFLYRTARIKRRFRLGDSEFIARPYPSAGGLYEVEFYVLVNRCDGLRPSLYYYDGLAHCLEHVSEPTNDTRQILLDAVQSSGSRGEPHLIIILAARFLRVNWKYESIAYSLVLKDVGVIYQTMYLVATAMGLAACALGGGNSASFCRAARLGYWEESSVGEFMLGRPLESSA